MALLGFGDIFGNVNRMIADVDRMMNGMMGGMDPMGMMSMNQGMSMGMSMSPFGMGHPGQMQSYSMSTGPGGFSHVSSSFTTISTDANGTPQIYQQTSSNRSGPGGIRETRETLTDSRRGVKKMAVGHHLNDRGHVRERTRHVYQGTEIENEEYINLAEEEAPQFENEWQRRAGRYRRHQAIDLGGSGSAPASPHHYHGRHRAQERLALPPAPSQQRSRSPIEVIDVTSNTSEPIIQEPDDDEDEITPPIASSSRAKKSKADRHKDHSHHQSGSKSKPKKVARYV